jgi:CspA family cold shock protein
VTTNTAKTHTGTCKWFGGHYGFITSDEPMAHGGKDMFVHISAVGAAGLRAIKEGDRMQYQVEIDKRSGKPCAANLKLI